MRAFKDPPWSKNGVIWVLKVVAMASYSWFCIVRIGIGMTLVTPYQGHLNVLLHFWNAFMVAVACCVTLVVADVAADVVVGGGDGCCCCWWCCCCRLLLSQTWYDAMFQALRF